MENIENSFKKCKSRQEVDNLYAKLSVPLTFQRQKLVNDYEAAIRTFAHQSKIRHVQAATEVLAMFGFHLAGKAFADYLCAYDGNEVGPVQKRAIFALGRRAEDELNKFITGCPRPEGRKAMADMVESFDFEGMGEIFRYLILMPPDQRATMEEVAKAMHEGTLTITDNALETPEKTPAEEGGSK